MGKEMPNQRFVIREFYVIGDLIKQINFSCLNQF